jgi:hypothetical protein
MIRTIVGIALVLTACKQKPADDKGATPGQSGAMGASGEMGSSMGTTMPDAAMPAPPVVVDAAVAKTSDDIAKRYEECIRFSNDAQWDDFKSCYVDTVMFEAPGLDAPRAIGAEIEEAKQARVELPDYRQEPQFVMVSGNTVIAMQLITATSKKTKKPIAFYLGHVVGADPQGKLTRDLAFWDAKTVEAQRTGKPGVRALAKPLPTKIALISKDDEIEKKNIEVFTKMMEAAENRDLVTFGNALADDVVWSVQNRPVDLTKTEILAGIKTRLEKTDLKYKLDHVWAAGDYVASIETMSGTATADSPDKTLKRGDKIERQLLAIHRFANGKLAQVWVFAQS